MTQSVQPPSAHEPRTALERRYGVKLVRGPFLRLPPHPRACTSEKELYALCRTVDKPTVADLFCGAGGLSRGLTDAGYEVVLAVDRDEEALETHRAYHPGLSVNWDLADPDVVERVGRIIHEAGIVLVSGGPPCQPFSRAGTSLIRDLVRRGRRDQHDCRRDLWESFLAVIEIGRPQAVLMENVPDMALDRGMVILRSMVERLESWGYSVEARVLEAWRYGVPQHRQRLILVGLRDGIYFRWPAESPERVTVENAIGDLPSIEGGWRPSNGSGPDPVATGWASYRQPLTAFQRRARGGVDPADMDKVFDHVTRPVREDDALAFAQMEPNTRYSQLAPELKRYRDDIFDDKYKRLDPNDLSRTITAHIAKDGYWYIHPWQDRTLTVREAARLQTFPDHVRFAGPPSAAFRQIGNAVPPLVGQRVGGAILSSLRQAEPTSASTGDVAKRLADWFALSPPRRVPWLAAESRWVVVQCELLWSRLADEFLTTAWMAVRKLSAPGLTLDAMPLLRRVAGALGRDSRCAAVEEAALWFSEHPESLGPTATAAELTAAPNVAQAIADLAVRVVPGDSEDPVLASYGVLRVAARFHGDDVDRRNRLSDGRLAIACMIGGEDTSHAAHLALVELANGICGPTSTECGRCPLEKWCAEARRRPVQPVLSPTSPMSPQP